MDLAYWSQMPIQAETITPRDSRAPELAPRTLNPHRILRNAAANPARQATEVPTRGILPAGSRSRKETKRRSRTCRRSPARTRPRGRADPTPSARSPPPWSERDPVRPRADSNPRKRGRGRRARGRWSAKGEILRLVDFWFWTGFLLRSSCFPPSLFLFRAPSNGWLLCG